MTDAEFWGVMAETLRGAETMPDWNDREPCHGLYAVIVRASQINLITVRQRRRLFNQIDRWIATTSPARWDHVSDEWRPRIKMCRELMKMAAKEGT